MTNNVLETSRKKSIWFYVVVTLLLVHYWALFDQALAGLRIGTADDISSGIVLGALCWWYIWKQLGRRPLVGSLVGICFYLLLLFIAILIQRMFITA